MSALYDDFAAAAIELLSDPDIAQSITLIKPGVGVYDEDSGNVVEGPPQTFDCSGVVFDYEERVVDGTLILAGDQRVILAPTPPVNPTPGDILALGGGERKQVVRSKPLAPGGQVVLIEVQARNL